MIILEVIGIMISLVILVCLLSASHTLICQDQFNDGWLYNQADLRWILDQYKWLITVTLLTLIWLKK